MTGDDHFIRPDNDVPKPRVGTRYAKIWIEPHCDQCWQSGQEVTWCQDDIYEPCEACGAKSACYQLLGADGSTGKTKI